MARTRASVGAKISSGKSSKARSSAAPPPKNPGPSGVERGSRSAGGGNSVCPRETPKWQRAITTFFITKQNGSVKDDTEAAGSSKRKRNIIESDDEVEDAEPPKNTELDETIDLEPLTGEDSHKIEEYYPKNGDKGKGVGKKTKDKENVNENYRNNKRERDDTSEESVSKKVKI